MVKIDFRGLIKREMKKQKINTPELARRVGLNSQTLYNYLAGKTEMKATNLEKVFEVLGIVAIASLIKTSKRPY